MGEREFWSGCPDVEIDNEKLHGQPTVGPYRVAVQTVVESEELGETAEEIAQNYGLPRDKVEAILNYWHTYHPEPARSR